jgi:hypothetical protein
MTAQHIGITPQKLELAIKQGESGPLRIAIPATKANGDPLDSYDGWTAKIALVRAPQISPELELSATVTGDAGDKQFVLDFNFSTDLTKSSRIGTLMGDLMLVDPSGEHHFPLNVTLSIERSFAGAA